MKQDNEFQEKKSNKKKQTGPGHLKERNHFDAKDMLLLVVMLIIIYGIMTWVEFFLQEEADSMEQNNSVQTTMESSKEINDQTAE